jgi:RNA polymerase sigma-70 factor, ECF subfamily
VAYTAGRGFLAPPLHARRPAQDGLDMLLEATARREHGAYNLVYEQLSAPVHAVIRGVLRDPAQAEEVAQEVLLEIWLVAFRYDATRGHAKAWVLTIARRRAIDRVRSAAAAEARERRTATMPYLDQVSDIVEDILEREQLRRCLGALSTLQREAIMLTFYDGYTNLQVASVLRVPLGTAKTRIRDGLIKLRYIMADAAAAPSAVALSQVRQGWPGPGGSEGSGGCRRSLTRRARRRRTRRPPERRARGFR